MIKEQISVVVPIYNVEEYLPKCVDSILSQSYHNLEIILVDDGSPDGCAAICDHYSSLDSRIKTLHIPNGGVAKARQHGVENSSGEYIVFVDPDDWLPLDSIESLYSNIEPEIDIVIAGVTSVDIKRGRSKDSFINDGVFSQREYTESLLLSQVRRSPYARLFRRSLFTKDSFPATKMGQDWLMNIEVSFRVRSVKYIPLSGYYYLYRPSSTMNTFTTSIDYERRYTQFVRDILQANGVSESECSAFYGFLMICLYRIIKRGEVVCCKEEWVKESIKECGEHFWSMPQNCKFIYIIIQNPYFQEIKFFVKGLKQRRSRLAKSLRVE